MGDLGTVLGITGHVADQNVEAQHVGIGDDRIIVEAMHHRP